MYPIPANATRIRYLESTGTQYVDTGVAPTTTLSLDCSGYFPNTTPGARFGSRVSASAECYYVISVTSNGADRMRLAFGASGIGSELQRYADPKPIRRFVLDAASKSASLEYADGTSGALSFSQSAFAGSYPIFLLAFNNAGTASYSITGTRLSACRIIDGSILVRSFVPVRVGQTGYLFDRVSGQLFGNAGTGDFVLGPDTFSQGVVPTRMMAMGVHDALPYTREIEYLESTGTQYIDTGVLIGPTTRIESSFACTSSSRPKTASLYYVTEQSPKINGVRTNNAGYLIAVVGGVGNQNGYDPISPRTIKTVTDFSTGYVFIRLQQGDSYIRDMSKTGSPLSEANTISMYIFANNNGGVANSFGAFRFMSMRVWESGVLVRDFVPVRKGTTGYLYDRVTKQLFGNAGTGSFTLGPDK